MTITKSLVHVIAQCTVCAWESQNYLAAQLLAKRHVKETGHRVKADLGYVAEYTP
jgi:hypothetical protein